MVIRVVVYFCAGSEVVMGPARMDTDDVAEVRDSAINEVDVSTVWVLVVRRVAVIVSSGDSVTGIVFVISVWIVVNPSGQVVT